MARRKKKDLTLQLGSVVYFENQQYVILRIIDLENVLAEHTSTGQVNRLHVSDVSLEPEDNQDTKNIPIDALPESDWQTARERLDAIRPLVHKPGRTAKDVDGIAAKLNVHRNTVYRWLKAYEDEGLLSVLAPKTERSDRGVKKLSKELEALINACLEDHYLTKQKKSVTNLYTELSRQCRNAGLNCPHINTIRNRISDLSNEVKVSKRLSSNETHTALHMDQGKFPHAEYPLSVIQIDHTPLDIILVDDVHRLPLMRPWVTMAIDVYSRMVVGFYVSFDPPGAISVGACLSNAILPKDKWLIEHNIDASWPCWGVPRTVHADNAKEFRGRMLQLACEQYGMTLEWRPVGKAHFGSHIESLLGTFAMKIHALPGTTFSNTTAKGDYDSSKNSAFTLKEFEQWLAHLIIEEYHHKCHTGIGCTPKSKYEEGIIGSDNVRGIGLPPRITDEHTLKLNFLPFVERTVQQYGVQIDQVNYYHDVLRTWIKAKDLDNPKLKRKFIFRRDPRDISIVWFFDPDVKTYYPIPYRNTSFPAISVWEFNAARLKLKEEGLKTVDEEVIFRAIDSMRQIEDQAVATTKKVRRAQQKRKTSAQKSIQPASKSSKSGHLLDNHTSSPGFSESDTQIDQGQWLDGFEHDHDEDPILPFDELEDLGNHG